jgi:ferritin
MKEAVRSALNRQINMELAAAYFYLSAAGYCASSGLAGFAQWLRLQSQEEVGHALRLFDFLHDRGSRAELLALDQPGREFASPLDAFSQALRHEQAVTTAIDALYALALREQDYPAQILLQWFVREQVEEEKNVTQVVEALKLVGDNASAMFLLQKELGARS